MDLKDQFQGTLYVKKPGLIALDVESPEKQKVVIEGRSYTVHFPEEGNTVRGEIPPEVDLEHFFAFFADINKMDQNFSIDFPAASRDTEDPLLFLELRNRTKSTGSYRILLGVDRQQYIVQRAIIYDALGNYNRFNLSGVTFLDSIPDSRFRIESSQSKTSAPFAIPFFKESDSD
jgi:outer membrane lipoprotein-sorting protein